MFLEFCHVPYFKGQGKFLGTLYMCAYGMRHSNQILHFEGQFLTTTLKQSVDVMMLSHTSASSAYPATPVHKISGHFPAVDTAASVSPVQALARLVHLRQYHCHPSLRTADAASWRVTPTQM